MAWRANVLAFLAVALALAPAASAAAAEGSLDVESGARFPAHARLPLAGALLVAPHSDASYDMDATASIVHVRLYEQRRFTAGVTGVGLAPEVRTWTWHGATLATVPSGGAQSIVLEPAPDGRLAFAPNAEFQVLHRRESRLTDDGGVHTEAAPDLPWYARTVRGSHLYVQAPGLATFDGRVVVRVQGADLFVASEENETTLWTGRRATGPHEVTERWAFLDLHDASLALSSPAAPVVAVGRWAEDASWRGRAHLVARGGSLVTPEAEYDPVGRLSLEGDFRASLRPAEGTGLRLDDLRGDLEHTTLAARARPASVGDTSPITLSLVAGAVLASAGGAVLLARRRARRPQPAPLAPRDAYQLCLDWADHFEREDDVAAALECLQAARRHVEEEEYVVVLWEATCHERLADLEEALARYEAALALAPKGDAEAAFGAAMVAGLLGHHDAALMHLRLALMAEPSLLDAVEAFVEDDPFRDLRGTPEFRRLMRDARAWVRAYDGE